MNTSSTKDEVALGAVLFFAALMVAGTIGLGGCITLIVAGISQGFIQILIDFGMIVVLGSTWLLLCPIMGLLASIANKSWYALKLWSAAAGLALLVNVVIGSAALWLGLQLRDSTDQEVAATSRSGASTVAAHDVPTVRGVARPATIPGTVFKPAKRPAASRAP